jgi:phosphoglucomutase
VFEGADGAEKIRGLARSYLAKPPEQIDGSKVVKTQDYSMGSIRDLDGDLLPKENLTIFELADGRRVAVRPSGTEPKIKFYLFGRTLVGGPELLNQAKAMLKSGLESLWAWLQEDAKGRSGSDAGTSN